MTSCDRITPLFSLHLEGESSPAEDALVRAHLVDCPECRQEFADLKATLALVRGLPSIEAPEGFEAQVLLRLREAHTSPAPAAEERDWERDDVLTAGRPTVLVIENRWWEHWIPRFAAAAAAAAVVALAFVGGQRMLGPGAGPGLAASDRIAATGDQAPGITPGTRVSPAGDDASGDGRLSAGVVSDNFSSNSVNSSDVNSSRMTSGLVTSAASSAEDQRRYDDLRSLFPDIPAEVIRAMPLNGETYASDRLVVRSGSVDGGMQVLAPVEYRGTEPVYIYR